MIILYVYNKDIAFINVLFFKTPSGYSISKALYSGGLHQDNSCLIILWIFTELLILLSELSPWSNQSYFICKIKTKSVKQRNLKKFPLVSVPRANLTDLEDILT